MKTIEEIYKELNKPKNKIKMFKKLLAEKKEQEDNEKMNEQSLSR